MKKIIVIIALCLVAATVLAVFAGCKKDEKKFIGTWYELDEEGNKTGTKLVLAKKGEGSYSDGSMGSGSVKWSVEKNKLFLTISICGMSESQEFTYKFSGNKMILTDEDGDVTTYTK